MIFDKNNIEDFFSHTRTLCCFWSRMEVRQIKQQDNYRIRFICYVLLLLLLCIDEDVSQM